MKKDKNNAFNVPDTGHEWDGIRDLTNPPPRWWTIGFHLSWIFALGYLILYPSIPLLNSHTKGILGYTQIKEFKEGVEALNQERKAKFSSEEEKLKTQSVDQIMKDNNLVNYVKATAKVLFGEKCSPCHGAGGQGNPGYPALVDDDWLYGGTVASIETTIGSGRNGFMPAYASQLNETEVDDLVTFIANWPDKKAHEAGKAQFTAKGCFACHGMEGKGNEAMGAVNLTDQIWRFAAADDTAEAIKASIKQTIMHGVNDPSDKTTRRPKMPAFNSRLSETDIKKLVIYVHQLGGGV